MKCLKGDQKEFVRKVILKAQQRFKSKSYNVFTKEINKVSLSSSDDKRMVLIDLVKTYA